MTTEIRVFGLSEAVLRQRLADLLADPAAGVTLSVLDGHGIVSVTAAEDVCVAVAQEVQSRLLGYVYSTDGTDLATCVVRLLTAHNLTVATAESCTGGMIAAALTDVPGASRVFGTGVVSYSNECKQSLLTVSEDTLVQDGAVSAATAGQMARGVRRAAEAQVGVSVTGEAGPTPAEAHPVGTVFIALADKKRTWVEQLHLDGADRAAIRRQAADSVLWLLWRYVSAYPAVMAGGEYHHVVQKREIPRTQGAKQPSLLSKILPWRGDSRRKLLVKCLAWLCVLALAVGCLWSVYNYLQDPNRNRELQDSLGNLYWNDSSDLTDGDESLQQYPEGMLAVFRGLYDRNPDVGGWIHIQDTGIDYPVMQYADAQYRNHNFAKQYSTYGQPYLDALFSLEHPRMMVVHGRNTGDGQMFSDLLNYRRVAYLQEHSVIEMNTLYGNGRYQIFAVLVLDSRDTDSFTIGEEPKDYADFIAALEKRSLFLSGLTVTEEDSLLLLTANAQGEYGFSGAQLVVAARRVDGAMAEPSYRVNYRVVMPRVLSGNGTTTRPNRTTTTTTQTTEVTTTTTTVTTTETTTTITTTQTEEEDVSTNVTEAIPPEEESDPTREESSDLPDESSEVEEPEESHPDDSQPEESDVSQEIPDGEDL